MRFKKRICNILVDVKKEIRFSFFLFFISIIFGLIAYPLFQEQIETLIQVMFSGVLVEGDDFRTIINVFIRNSTTSFLILMSGCLILPTILIISVNGFLVGLIVRYVIKNGMHPVKVFLTILPHGIFEIPALMISAGIGFSIGLRLLKPKGMKRWEILKDRLKISIIVYFTIIVPMLIIAAIIEILISKNLVS